MEKTEKPNVTLVLDCDGIITDIWTPAEARLRQYDKYALTKYADENNSVESLEAFTRNFMFNNYIKDFKMSALNPVQRKLVTTQWDAVTFEFPYPMYHSDDNRWVADSRVPVENRIPFHLWAEWLNVLTRRGVEVILHSHVYTKEIAKARRLWFRREIKAIAPLVKLKLDIGAEKEMSSGTIVVEDNLDNLIADDAKYKILRSCFHNQICCVPGSQGYDLVTKGEIYTYSSFFTLQYLVSLFVQGKTVAQVDEQLERMYG